ncbi:hypothetical protein BT96DRAFT_114808 [Gymnopus androsaceus JB14]|uniref:F-box domain-containing protein n=1 Tax=Gymnopus androsaceus JB14 TaxID=1447944 RepID=A0A6A4HET6_9AGAR|nr:hypothetical protein BT96DRAFT_114808 [Gymnopus androsaceus JB14]
MAENHPLPQELLEIISENFDSRSDLKAFSTVCRSWRDATRARVLSAISLPTKSLASDEKQSFLRRRPMKDAFRRTYPISISGVGDDGLLEVEEVGAVFDAVLLSLEYLNLVTHLVLEFDYSLSILASSVPHFPRLKFPRLRRLTFTRLAFNVNYTASFVHSLAQLILQHPSIDSLSFRKCVFTRLDTRKQLIDLLAACQSTFRPCITQFALDDYATLWYDLGISSVTRLDENILKVESTLQTYQVDRMLGNEGLLQAIFSLMDLSCITCLIVRGVTMSGYGHVIRLP